MTKSGSDFPAPDLPAPLVADLRRQNPWWTGEPAPVQPGPRRHLVGQIRRRLNLELAPIVAVRGPRQVGKTTAQLQIIEDLLAEGVPPHTILRVQFDELGSLQPLVDPILRIADWFEHHIAGTHFNRLARAGQWAHLLFDEVQVVGGWHVQLKFLVDNASVRTMITGSSALRIEQGRDSLAGRISTIEAGVFSLTEIGPLHGLETPKPFLPTNGLSGLLEALLQLTCRYAGLAPAVSELAEQVGLSLNMPVDGRRVTRYLNLLADTLLVRLVPPLDVRLRKNRGGPKLCLADHALRACWLQEQVPLAPDALAERQDLTTQAGHLAESVFGSAASLVAGLDIAHWPKRGADREVDFVLTVGVLRVPVEIKYQRRIDPYRDTAGLRSFLEKTVNNAAFGILITQDASGVVDDPRIVSLPLSTFLLLR